MSSLVTGLNIEFMGVTYYANNTAININEVGEGDNAVLCRTDLTTCCGFTEGETWQGNWRYPNGTLVNNNASDDDIYRDRRTMVVRLHRRNNATTPTGQYCCEVPTIANPSSNGTICIILCELTALPSAQSTIVPTIATTAMVCLLYRLYNYYSSIDGDTEW